MNDLTIWPIHVGTIKGVEKSNLTYGINQGVKIDVPSIIYLIKGGPELIVVDTGMSDPEWATRYHHPATRTPSGNRSVQSLTLELTQMRSRP